MWTSARPRRRAVLLVVGVLSAACSGDSSVGPGDTRPADLGALLDRVSIPAGDRLGATMGMPFMGGRALVPSTCSYSAESRSFVCPTISTAGLTVVQGYTLLDASGAPQSRYDAASTAAVRVTRRTTGTLGSGSLAIALNGESDLTLGGLLTGTYVLNGTDVMTTKQTGTPDASFPSLDGRMTATVTNVVLPSSTTGADRWPKSGTVLVELSTGSGTTTAPAPTMLLTFNGTNLVPLTLTMGAQTERCTLDLTWQTPMTCMTR